MEIKRYIDEKKDIQYALLEFIENTKNEEENFAILISLINFQDFEKDPYELITILNLILKISFYHNRSSTFFSKIERILMTIKDNIQQTFTNHQIFNLCKKNKRILLFFFKKVPLITIDDYIFSIMSSEKYVKQNYFSYFYPEVKSFLKSKNLESINKILQVSNLDDFELNRENGENEHFLSELIRNDLIDQFISYVKQNDLPLSTLIKPSIFETNSLLVKKKKLSLIQYSAFFGSLQIFKYLHLNQIDILDSSIWIYAIHGDNSELISYLEENEVELDEKTLKKIILEAIKCHHNDMVNYIQKNFLEIKNDDLEFNSKIIKYFNYTFISNNLSIVNLFPYFCKYNHVIPVKILLNDSKIDINQKIKNDNHIIVKLLLEQERIEIGPSTFYGCTKMTEIELPSFIETIPEDLFGYCSSLTQIKIPSSVKKIGKYAFEKCVSLKTMTIPSSVVIIDDYAFSGCSNLSEIPIPPSVIEIGKYAFEECSSLIKVSIPSSLKSIVYGIFMKCTSLNEVKIPSNITFIEPYSFSKCNSLKYVEIPSSVTAIGQYAFMECSLIELTIPSSVKIIGRAVFQNCSLLESIILPSSMTNIESAAFSDCSSLVEINLPSSILKIEDYTFKKCSSLKQIVIPPSVTSIGVAAFQYCSSLLNISIPSSVISVGNCAFFGCNSLEQAIIESVNISFGKSVFDKCCSLREISIPSVNDIKEGTFPANVMINKQFIY